MIRLTIQLILLCSGPILLAQNWTAAPGADIQRVYSGTVTFEDVDGDGDEDLFITGKTNPGEVSILYFNQSGNFVESSSNSFPGVESGSIAFSDVDNDGDADLLITGRNTNEGLITKLYLNDGGGEFSEVSATAFEGVTASSIAFADVDNDGDEDVLITGWNSSEQTSKLYLNDGTGSFSEDLNTDFDQVSGGSIAFADVDNDGDEDVLIGGFNSSDKISKLYLNDGTGSFSESTNDNLVGVSRSSIAFSDIDNDGDMDLLITGDYNDFDYAAKLYRNNGEGDFSEVAGDPITPILNSSVAFADIDNDGDEDLLISGERNSFTGGTTELMTNDGAGNFTEVQNTPFTDLAASAVAFSDIDGDGDKDVLITGLTNASWNPHSELFLNDLNPSNTNNLTNNLHFNIYPNPASKTTTISIEGGNSTINIKVNSLDGRLVRESKILGFFGRSFVLDISDLEKGTYILQLENGPKSGSQKLLIR